MAKKCLNAGNSKHMKQLVPTHIRKNRCSTFFGIDDTPLKCS